MFLFQNVSEYCFNFHLYTGIQFSFNEKKIAIKNKMQEATNNNSVQVYKCSSVWLA